MVYVKEAAFTGLHQLITYKINVMIVDYFKIPEIRVSYKDKVKASERFKVSTSFDVVKIFKNAFKDCMQHHEESYAIFLNQANRVIGITPISKCGISETMVDIRIVMQIALKVCATGLVFSHNHPSGNLNPSESDVKLTRILKHAGELLNIRLIDHIIMTEEYHYSFADEGRL